VITPELAVLLALVAARLHGSVKLLHDTLEERVQRGDE
jgi:hypothetical protein